MGTAVCICFEKHTTVETRSGTQKMAELTVGDEVRTLDNSRSIWTKVLNIYKIDGDFEFVTLQTDSRSLTATREHPVYVRENGQDLRREAGFVALGDVLLQSSGGEEAAGVVVNITKSREARKILIDTEHGSVLANGILAGTAKGNEILKWSGWAALNVSDPAAFTAKWDQDNDGKLTSQRRLIA